MITTSELAKAVGQALDYLKSAEQVAEAEVFASSNRSLITRLNYTSHIPCNGVEEAKSTESCGIGIQAAFRTDAGITIGFGSEPSDLNLDGVKRALEKARRGAVTDPEFSSLPQPSGERRRLRRYHDPKLMRIRDGELVEAGWKVLRGGLTTFMSSTRLRELAGGQERIKELGLILGGDVTILQERIAIASSAMPEVQTDESTLIMAFITAMVEAKTSKGTGSSTGTRLDSLTDEAGVEAAQNAIAAIGGERIKSGEYTVIFGRQPVADLLNNLILPSLSLSAFYSDTSTFMGKLGKPVASKQLTLLDHGAQRGLMGSKGITCEGLPTGKTRLIQRGKLVGLLSNHYERQRILKDPKGTEKLGADPSRQTKAIVPRNGFRFGTGGGRHFSAQPGIAPTNIIVEGGDRSLEEMIAEVKDGLLIGRIWYTYPINGLRAGDFTCTVVGDSYIIKEGRIVAPLKPNTVRISDNIRNILSNITSIGTDAKGTLVWAADEVIYTPQIVVRGVKLDEIAGFMEQL
ncbi:MAG: TldD/PmbA family protein [Candidatus Methylomirabilis oxyfera]|nr:TldD/PmbA family protein [Candidatus Methylomirabilis oxyfera]